MQRTQASAWNHRGLHYHRYEDTPYTSPISGKTYEMTSSGSTSWSETVDRVEESGMVAPWLIDVLREIENERKDK